MTMRHLALLLIWFAVPAVTLAQQANRKQMVYFDAKNRTLPSPTGATYAVQTEYIDSLRAIERWYSGPNKIQEVVPFSNIKRRLRDGETLVYYSDGSIRKRILFENGKVKTLRAYYPSGKLQKEYQFAERKAVEKQCYSSDGLPMPCDTASARRQCVVPKESSKVYYPRKAAELGIEGRVEVQFVVDRFGKLAGPWILESPSPLLSNEALAAVRRLKNWCPGFLDGEPIDGLFTQPITFKIE